jgi:hypothetical protein
MAIYEYVLLVRENKQKNDDFDMYGIQKKPAEWCDYYLWWPGRREPETHLNEDMAEWSNICAQLGSLGWRLLLSEIPKSAVAYKINGWQGPVSFPVTERWYFERVVSP